MGKPRIKKIARKVLKHEKRKRGVLTVVLVNNRKIRVLNRKYRKVNKVTDVLAFSYGKGLRDGKERYLGDIVISVERAAKQATEFGKSLASEMDFLVAHGVLHLLGYNDSTKKGFNRMMRLQEKIIAD